MVYDISRVNPRLYITLVVCNLGLTQTIHIAGNTSVQSLSCGMILQVFKNKAHFAEKKQSLHACMIRTCEVG